MVSDDRNERQRDRGRQVHTLANGLIMDTKLVKTVAMYGPSISNPARIVNRAVPVCDIQAYRAAGYVLGSIEEVPEIVYTEADAIAQNDGEDVTATVTGKRSRRK